MNHVFIVTSGNRYEGYEVEGVFSSPKKALEFIQRELESIDCPFLFEEVTIDVWPIDDWSRPAEYDRDKYQNVIDQRVHDARGRYRKRYGLDGGCDCDE